MLLLKLNLYLNLEIEFNKEKGQHILKNPLILNAIIEKVRYFCFSSIKPWPDLLLLCAIWRRHFALQTWLWRSGRALGTWQCDFSSGALVWQRSRSILDLLLSSRNESHIGTSPPHLCTAKITTLTPELPSSHSPYTARLELVLGDVLKCEPLPHFDVCVANLPYQVCALIFGFPLMYMYVQTTSTCTLYNISTYELNAVLFVRVNLIIHC